ncbi:ABC transporter permease [Niallia circulans]|uniref:ABC transporter permease n=1 Tax=Niallia circulans TaxID=1397 RepID=A0A553SF38_NIACI|nr:FtsX-like permease family protein [Niallia circulans]TRZ35609.1 ABC transporter permease [Niallia circulans]
MNIIQKLTIRHLKENKRRTIVTIIGVIISTAMIMAVATLGVSFLDLSIRQSISTDGEWHLKYEDVNQDQIAEIEKDDATKELFLSKDLGYSEIEDATNIYKPYIFYKAFNEAGFNAFHIKIDEGRLPENPDELILSESIVEEYTSYKIGDKITVDIGKRVDSEDTEGKELTQQLSVVTDEEGNLKEELANTTEKTFTIVGIMENPTWAYTWEPGYTALGYVDFTTIAQKDTADAVVVLNKVNGSIYEHADGLAKKVNTKKITYNDELLRYYGVTDNDSLRTTLYGSGAVIVAVIIIGSVALIYNAFAISVSERARHLGMLSSVGATKKQKRNAVFFEGMVIGAISIPIGILAGIGGIGATFIFLNSFIEGALGVSEKLELVVTPYSVLIAIVVSVFTIFISAFLPARKASKISAIDAIRQTQDVKLTGKAVKTSKFVRKLFGIEAEIGLKNLKRHKRRYHATVFSLIISIVLFLAVSFFTSNIKKSLELSQENVSFDIQVYGSGFMQPSDYIPLTKLSNVENSTILQESYMLSTWVKESAIADELKEMVADDNSLLKDGKFQYTVHLVGLDEASFQAYAKEAGVSLDKFTDENNPMGILVNKISYQDFDTKKFIETTSVHAKNGDNFELHYSNEGEGDTSISKVGIAGITTKLPIGMNTAGVGSMDIIVSDKIFSQLSNNAKTKDLFDTSLYLNSSDPLATQKELEDVKTSNMYIYNVYQNKQENEQMLLFMSVFTYGFITLISLISVANIFNTISTSIALRKREFAMLRSVGMTPKGFNKMLQYESMFYGLKALLYGLPLSIAVMVLLYFSIRQTFEYGFALPWMSILFSIIAIFIIVGLAMMYATVKIKKENIIDGLKQENI